LAGVIGVLTRTSVDSRTVTVWMAEVVAAVRAEAEYLTQLDAAIGDGDHGTNMRRGFDAVDKALAVEDGETPPGRLLTLVGKTLIATVGGASGPLYGTAFRRAGRSLGSTPSFGGAELAIALDEAIAGVVDLGAAQVADKTLVDALVPAAAAMHAALDGGASLEDAVAAAAEAAESGARATVPMQARKGRASYLGERSIGHQDPGATSSALILRALERAVRKAG
jgi:phosphoenolpyruvate---glycerone phosphotransferase subunit DhaL